MEVQHRDVALLDPQKYREHIFFVLFIKQKP